MPRVLTPVRKGALQASATSALVSYGLANAHRDLLVDVYLESVESVFESIDINNRIIEGERENVEESLLNLPSDMHDRTGWRETLDEPVATLCQRLFSEVLMADISAVTMIGKLHSPKKRAEQAVIEVRDLRQCGPRWDAIVKKYIKTH